MRSEYIGKGDDGGGRQLDGSGRQPTEGEEKFGANAKNFEPGGGVHKGIREIFQSGSAVRVSFWGRYVGPNSLYGAVLEQLSDQSYATAHREAAEATVRGELGMSSAGGDNGGSGL